MRLKAVCGYTIAVMATVVALATFLGMDFFARQLVSATGLKVSPWFTGGEIVRTVDRGNYVLKQHRAVFDGLVGEKTEGFVQLDFAPPDALPDKIAEEVDYDLDGQADFRIEYDPKANSAVLRPYTDRVLGLAGCYELKERRAVRINLRNK